MTTYTVGIEIEAALLGFGKYTADNIRDEIIELLQEETNLSVRDEGWDPDFEHWVVKNDMSVDWVGSTSEYYNAGTEEAPAKESVEFNSPIWKHDRPTMLSELESVLNTLKSQNVPGEAHRFVIRVNDTCSMHVHVGMAEAQDLENIIYLKFRDVRNLAMLITAAEFHIGRMHTELRNLGGSRGMYCKPPSLMWTGESGTRDVPPLSRALDVAVAESSEEIVDMFGNNGNTPGYRFRVTHPENAPRTVEFRQHEGTLDPRECVAWIAFCTALVRTAHESSEVRIFDLLEQTTDEQADLFNFFEAIGLAERHIEFYGAKLGLQPGIYPGRKLHNEEQESLYVTLQRLKCILSHR